MLMLVILILIVSINYTKIIHSIRFCFIVQFFCKIYCILCVFNTFRIIYFNIRKFKKDMQVYQLL